MGDKEVCVDRESRTEHPTGYTLRVENCRQTFGFECNTSQGNTRVPAPGWNCTGTPET